MTDFPDWLNAVAATAAAIFSFLAWRSSNRTQAPEAVIQSAVMGHSSAYVRFSIRNLTDQTLYVRGISFARCGVPLEVAQGYDQTPDGSQGEPKDFRGKTIENVGWMVAHPAGTQRGIVGSGDRLWIDARLRFAESLPADIVVDLAYSYGSPTGRKQKLRTNRMPLQEEPNGQ